MKHWDEAIRRAQEAKAFMANRSEQVCLWLAEFVLEQHTQAVAHVESGDAVQTARQLTIVQARCTELLEQVRELIRESKADWEDKPDEWTPAIKAAHPTRTGSHDKWGVAMGMVGHRHSKGALVELVHWLLGKHTLPVPEALRSSEESEQPYTDSELDELWMWSKQQGWSPVPATVHRLFATIRAEAKRDLEGAIRRAGFRVAPDYHGNATLWCLSCKRDSGFHHDTCEKAKRYGEP